MNDTLERLISSAFQEVQVKEQESDGSKPLPRLSSVANDVNTVLLALEQILNVVKAQNPVNQVFQFPRLTETLRLSVQAKALATYFVAGLSPEQLSALTRHLNNEIMQWFQRQMRLPSTAISYYASDLDEARFSVCQAVIHRRFPEFRQDGFLALQQLPVIYSSRTTLFNDSVCLKLGLPLGSVRYLPLVKSSTLSSFGMSTSALEAAILEDIREGRAPLLVSVHIGPGHIDDIIRIKHICEQNQIWLHVEGDDIALLMSLRLPPSHAMVVLPDSFTINIGRWLGFGFPLYCTFFRELIPSYFPFTLDCCHILPVWVVMHHLGEQHLPTRIARAVDAAQVLANQLTQNPSITLLSTIGSSLSVVFRYVPQLLDEPADKNFLNNLNKQLLLDLSETAAPLNLDLSKVNEFVCLRYQPLFSESIPFIFLFSLERSLNIKVSNQTKNNILVFTQNLLQETKLIDATLRHRSVFGEAVKNYSSLTNVVVDSYVGLGAVRFVPTYLQGVNELGEEVRKEIDELNSTLAERLHQLDTIFYSGRTTEGFACVCLGVETRPITAELAAQFAQTIYDTAKTLHIDEKIDENFSELLKKSIRQAEESIRQETQEVSDQQSYIRRMPVIGSVWNWWVPTEEPKTDGRSFDLFTASLKKVPIRPSKTVSYAPINESNEEKETVTPLQSTQSYPEKHS